MVEQVAIVTSPSVDRFIDQLAANGGEVALIDAAAAPNPIEAFTRRLRQQFPRVLIVLTGSPQLQTTLSAPIADGTIFRFVHKPVSAKRLKLFINAALRRGRQGVGPVAAAHETPAATPGGVRRTQGAASAEGLARAGRPPSEAGHRSAPNRAPRARQNWGATALLVALALLGLGIIAWERTGHSFPLHVDWPP